MTPCIKCLLQKHEALSSDAHVNSQMCGSPVTPETGSQRQTDLRGSLYSQVIQSTALQGEW